MSGFIPLLEFIPALSPKLSAPHHLTALTDVFERIARGESVHVTSSVPPRHAKTETISHGCAWLLAQNPELRIAYASYAQRVAEKKSRRIREFAKRAGVPIAGDNQSKSAWSTTEGDGGLWATSTGGSITGEGFDLIVIDDPVKGRAEAESSLVRERATEWLVADVLTRLEPGGSIIVNGTRWHPDDLVGYASGLGWETINLPAISAEGAPLWPERWPLADLLKLRETMGGPDGYEWQSLYQGNPRGRGARVFGDVHHYDALPPPGEIEAVRIGLDFAYSTRTSADWSVAVVLARAGERYYLLDVIRVHEEPRSFRARVQLACETHPQAIATAYAAATEMGGIEFIRDGEIPIDARTATVDKFSRAIPVAAAWNTGKILLPRSSPWLNAFVSELCGFTGVKDRHDDQVDALAAAFDGCAGGFSLEQWLENSPSDRIGRSWHAESHRSRVLARDDNGQIIRPYRIA